MTKHSEPDLPEDRILEAVRQIQIPRAIPFSELQAELRRVVKELKKHKVTQVHICNLLKKESGRTYTVTHFRNNVLQKDGYQQTAAWVLQCLGYEVFYGTRQPKKPKTRKAGE